MKDFKKTLDDCLDEAGRIQMRYYEQLGDHEVVQKGASFDLQTVADTECEKAIIGIIQKRFPDHAILTEETGGVEQHGASVRWIVDPIDGTTNFRHGFPMFAVSIGVEVDGAMRLGGVYNPFRQDRFTAEKDQGAFWNGKRIAVSEVDRLEDSLIVAGFPYDRLERADRYMDIFKDFLLRSHGVIRLGSAALDFCHVASGQFEAYYEESIHPWDWAAGKLILEEAGGMVTDYEGGDKMAERAQFLATNGRVHAEMLAILRNR